MHRIMMQKTLHGAQLRHLEPTHLLDDIGEPSA
jgi:hypothetical protein